MAGIHYLVHYNEIGLKKGNRGYFEGRLIKNIYRAASGLGVEAVRRLFGRILVVARPDVDAAELEARLARVYGIASYAPVTVLGLDLDAARAVLEEWAEAGGFESFAMRARRVNKEYPRSSQELNVELGAWIQRHSGARVDLSNPERTFELVILNQQMFLFHRRCPGPGGLPVGASGRVMLLLSGGIDSPVAAERMLRRGCTVHFTHFHSSPFTDRSSVDKALEIARVVVAHRQPANLHVVPLGKLQQQIVAETPSPYRVMLYRRYMLRLAAELARRDRCEALVTGEAIGQVASQTLGNIAVLDRTVAMPILRPLVGFDKLEIIAEAQAAGTYELSIEPHSDCCSYLQPAKPVTRARLQDVEEIEAGLDVADLLEELLAATETVALSP